MEFSAKYATNLTTLRTDCLIVPVLSLSGAKTKSVKTKKTQALQGLAAELDKAMNGQLLQLLKDEDLSSELGKTLLLHHPAGLSAKRLLLIGAGEQLNLNKLEQWISPLSRSLKTLKIKKATIAIADLDNTEINQNTLCLQLARQLEGASYEYSETKSEKPAASSLKQIEICIANKDQTSEANQALNEGLAMGSGMNLAKELGNLPGNVCTPSYLANLAKKMAKDYPALSTSILSEAQMKTLKMGSFLSVSAGSDQPAKLITMEYKGGKKGDQPIVLVGKGVTFDSGGISLKPGAKMDEMKYDMCGAASVFGTIKAIAELKAPINVVALVGATENMPSGCATKPGDVVTSMSGQTIEILNTDAEGRLVLCDVLSYAGKFKPKTVIDIATLTGACVVALGGHATGLFSNDDAFADELAAAGTEVHDRAWHMPLWDEYNKQLDSNFADMQNIGGPEGGSVTAACFLSRFTKDYTWAHLDIAGTAWTSGANKGASGRPVSMLTQYLLNQC
jgi:leucyl aminopeptidase